MFDNLKECSSIHGHDDDNHHHHHHQTTGGGHQQRMVANHQGGTPTPRTMMNHSNTLHIGHADEDATPTLLYFQGTLAAGGCGDGGGGAAAAALTTIGGMHAPFNNYFQSLSTAAAATTNNRGLGTDEAFMGVAVMLLVVDFRNSRTSHDGCGGYNGNRNNKITGNGNAATTGGYSVV
jgi:hypothetical protein